MYITKDQDYIVSVLPLMALLFHIYNKYYSILADTINVSGFNHNYSLILNEDNELQEYAWRRNLSVVLKGQGNWTTSLEHIINPTRRGSDIWK